MEQLPNYLDFKVGGITMATHFDNDGELSPDPTRKRLIYPTIDDDYIYSTLWDIENRKVLAKLRYYPYLYNDPLWLLDGNDFLIISYTHDNYAEWFQVTRDGGIRQVSQFSDFLKPGNYSFAIPSLSGDGHYLAFQVSFNNSNLPPRDLILDLWSGNIQAFCIDAVPWGSQPTPIWSPDERYLVISNTTNHKGNLILVDVEQQRAYRIAEDVDAIGWIEKP